MTRDINYSFDWVLPYASPFATVLTDSINFGYIGKTYAWILSWSLSDIEVEATSPRDIPEAEADPAGLASSSLRGILDDRPTDPLDPDRGFDFMRIAEDYTRCNDFAQLPDDIDALIADYEEARNRSRFPSLELQYVWDCVGKTAVPRFNGEFIVEEQHLVTGALGSPRPQGRLAARQGTPSCTATTSSTLRHRSSAPGGTRRSSQAPRFSCWRVSGYAQEMKATWTSADPLEHSMEGVSRTNALWSTTGNTSRTERCPRQTRSALRTLAHGSRRMRSQASRSGRGRSAAGNLGLRSGRLYGESKPESFCNIIQGCV